MGLGLHRADWDGSWFGRRVSECVRRDEVIGMAMAMESLDGRSVGGDGGEAKELPIGGTAGFRVSTGCERLRTST